MSNKPQIRIFKADGFVDADSIETTVVEFNGGGGLVHHTYVLGREYFDNLKASLGLLHESAGEVGVQHLGLPEPVEPEPEPESAIVDAQPEPQPEPEVPADWERRSAKVFRDLGIPADKYLLTAKEYARAVGLSESKVHNDTARGHIPYTRAPHSRRILIHRNLAARQILAAEDAERAARELPI